MKLDKVGIIVAARTNSSRLPGKALLPLLDRPMILYLLERLQPLAGAVVVFATTELPSDDHLADIVNGAGFPVFRGSANDLVSRYVDAANHFGFDTVGRVTGDCPFVSTELVEHCLAQASAFERFDLATTKGRFPVGLDVELYRSESLAALNTSGDLTMVHREHLTLYFYDHRDRFDIRTFDPRPEWKSEGSSFTVDTQADYDAAAALAGQLGRTDFTLNELVRKLAA